MRASRVRRENDCRLFIQQICSKEGLYNVTEVTEIAWQLHPHLKFDTLDALIFSHETDLLCCHRRCEVSFIRFSGDLERTSVSVFL